MSEIPSFQGWKYYIVYIYHTLLIYYSIIGHLVALLFCLLWKMWLWTQEYRYLFETQLSILLGVVHWEVELLGHVVILCLIFWGTAIVFSTICTIWQYISTNSAQRCWFLQPSLQHLIFSFSFSFVDNGHSHEYEVGRVCTLLHIDHSRGQNIFFFCLCGVSAILNSNCRLEDKQWRKY